MDAIAGRKARKPFVEVKEVVEERPYLICCGFW
jgi:hypothetical protein